MSLTVGQQMTWERTFIEKDVRQFAELSGDRGANHVEPGPDGRLSSASEHIRGGGRVRCRALLVVVRALLVDESATASASCHSGAFAAVPPHSIRTVVSRPAFPQERSRLGEQVRGVCCGQTNHIA